MKKYILIISSIHFMVSCSSSQKAHSGINQSIEEKTKLIENANTEFSTATIVGLTAEILLEKERKKIREKKINDLINSLKDIEGVNIITHKDDNSFEMSVENDIFFEFDKVDLTPQALNILDKIYTNLADLLDSTKFKIVGHTDNVGSVIYNLELSKLRAKAVGNYFKERGANENKIKEFGKGLSSPIADNKTEEGRAKNRRVEITIIPEI